MSNTKDAQGETKEADPNTVSIKVRGQVRTNVTLGAVLDLKEGTHALPGRMLSLREAAT